jgi:hypothetical protein
VPLLSQGEWTVTAGTSDFLTANKKKKIIK